MPVPEASISGASRRFPIPRARGGRNILLARIGCGKTPFGSRTNMTAAQAPIRIFGVSLKTLLTKAAIMLGAGLLLGWVYAWASPRVYPQESALGFSYGVVHGGLMPMALPSLLMGQDVEIFASNNSGRGYKLGYIVGINLCGLIFFGSAFWRPRVRQVDSVDDVTAYKNQPR